MPMSSHSSLMMLLSKLAPQSLRSLARAPKIKMYPCHRNLAMVFVVWLGVTWAIMCFVKCLQKTGTFTAFGGWSSFILISMLLKSMCSSSKGVVAMMGCIGALAQVPSCWMHHSQLPIAFCICVTMLGHQDQLCSRCNVCCWPWYPASWWHPFIAATQWAVGPMNCKISSNFPAGVWQWWGLLNRASALEGLPFPPQCSWSLPRDASDPLLSNWRSTQSWL